MAYARQGEVWVQDKIVSSAVTLTSDPLTLKLVHRVLVSQGPFLLSLVFVGLFVFPLGGGTGQTDRWTGSAHDGAS